jgi:spermidine synthase|tara:strand:+ start:831 stop:3287 length:2457 start_codon:yes stop_codon:yes gene_type:complete
VSLLWAIAVLSAGVLGFEVLLVRLYGLVQWPHFAYMIISIALLGFGASGTFLALTERRLRPRFLTAFAVNAAVFGISAPASFAIVQSLPFNPLEVIWNPAQLLYLVPIYLLFTVPFFCAANCVGLAFICRGDRIGRIYRYNLLGSGIGAIGIIAAFFVIDPQACLGLVAGIGFAAAAIACLGGSGRNLRRMATVYAGAGLIVALGMPGAWTDLKPSQFKGLAIALKVKGAEKLAERHGPLGQITVVRNQAVPFRYAPGLSLNSPSGPPNQLAIFYDADTMSVVTAYDGRRQSLAYLDHVITSLPYHLRAKPSVLVLGSGGGSHVLEALYHHAERIDAVELNPDVVRIARDEYGVFAGGVYSHPRVRLHIGEARAFVAGSGQKWDLIQLPLLDSFATAAAGVRGLGENYLYTVEAFGDYLGRLESGGILAISRWLKLPPRDSLKLLATARAALRRKGISNPEKSLALIRSWNMTTLLVKNGAYTKSEISRMRAFANNRSFDLAYYPGMPAGDANRFNKLDAPYFNRAANALLGRGLDDFMARYKFDIAPATDDRPYFFDFFKWRTLPEFLAMRTLGAAALLELGYLLLVATFVQAFALSVLLILLPLWLLRRSTAAGAAGGRGWRVIVYFLGLGLGFMFIEIAFIQRFVVFLGHPLFAIAVVISAFLVFAGLGSGFAPRLSEHWPKWRGKLPNGFSRLSPIGIAVFGIAAAALIYLVLLPHLFGWFLPLNDIAKIVISLALIAPLGFLMGLPFPLGLSRVSEYLPGLVPWAWGVNGCASVLGAILATILAVHMGFSAVIVLAVAVYAAAAAVFKVGSAA